MSSFVHRNFEIDQEVDRKVNENFDKNVNDHLELAAFLDIDEEAKKAAQSVESVMEQIKLQLKRKLAEEEGNAPMDTNPKKKRKCKKSTSLYKTCLDDQFKKRREKENQARLEEAERELKKENENMGNNFLQYLCLRPQ